MQYRLIICFILCQLWLLSAKAQLYLGDAFLKGQYCELGLGSCGAYQSFNDPPGSWGYHFFSPLAGTGLGLIIDHQKDGWTSGIPNYCGDYFPIGTVEGFVVELSPNIYSNRTYINSCTVTDVIGSIISYDTSLVNSAIWQGSISYGLASGLSIRQNAIVTDSGQYVITKVKLTNTSSSTMRDLYYMRALSTSPDGFSSPITQTITAQTDSISCKAAVEILASTFGCYFTLAAIDKRARVSMCDCAAVFSYSPHDWYSPPPAMSFAYTNIGSTLFSPSGCCGLSAALSFKIDSLQAGESTSFSFAYVLNASDLEQALTSSINRTVHVIKGSDTSDISYSQRFVQCDTGALRINISGFAAPDFDYSWYPASEFDTAQGYQVVFNGQHTADLMAIGLGDCYNDTFRFRVVIDDMKDIIPPADTHICAGADVQLFADSTAISCYWSDSSLLSNGHIVHPVFHSALALDNPQLFTVLQTSYSGCQRLDSVWVGIDSFRLSAGADDTICPGTDILLNAVLYGTDSLSIGLASFHWLNQSLSDTNIANPIFQSNDSSRGSYYFYLEASVQNEACVYTDSLRIWVDSLPFPSLFGLDSWYCTNQIDDSLIGFPEGGSFYGPGISASLFSAAFFTSMDTAIIYYQYTDSSLGCVIQCSDTAYIFPAARLLQDVSICEGDSLVVADSVYYNSGTYLNVFEGRFSCDSTLRTELVVLETQYDSQYIHLCYGESWMVNTNIYDQSGEYFDWFTASSGCDSLLTTVVDIEDSINKELLISGASLSAVAAGYQYQWYDCGSGLLLEGDSFQTFTATYNGSFAIILSNGFCSDSSDCVEVKGLAIPEMSIESLFRLYPNPSSNQIYLELREAGNLSIWNAVGQHCFINSYTAGTHMIDIGFLSPGLYQCTFRSTHQSKQQLMIILY